MIPAVLWIILAKIIALLALLLTLVAYIAWHERRVIAGLQSAWNPVGFAPPGPLQPLVDLLKLFAKEDILPTGGSRFLHRLAPALAMIAALLAFAVIPVGPSVHVAGVELFQIADLDIGLLFVFAVSSLGLYGAVLAGWASNSKYALLGSLRCSAQMISYSLALGLALVGVLLMSGSMSLRSIVESQSATWWGFLPRWNIFPQCIAFACYFIAALAQARRPPFDLPESESELVGGYYTEYSSVKLGMFLLARYANFVCMSCMATVLFLGGWDGPRFGPDWLQSVLPPLWFFLKVFGLLFLCVRMRGTLPRFRQDQLVSFGWKVLAPLALLNVVGTSMFLALKYS
jgi:NADH-quinone oxidoreductase subunit H